MKSIDHALEIRGRVLGAFEMAERGTEPAGDGWLTFGVQASRLGRVIAEQAGVDLDRKGRVKVEHDCTRPGHPEVFATGDLMNIADCQAGHRSRSRPNATPRVRSSAASHH